MPETTPDSLLLVGDPPADEVVRKIVADTSPKKAEELFGILIRHIRMPLDKVPDYVRNYMQTQGQFPHGWDADQVQRGQQVFLQYGPWLLLSLYCKSLPVCYLHHLGAPVLELTGRLSGGEGTGRYTRRIWETFQFVVDVMGKGNLTAGGSGIDTTLKVRLVHAAIRNFTQENPEWKPPFPLLPINQSELLYAFFTFNVSVIEASRKLGVNISDAEAEDYYYTWRLVAHFLGIQPELIPATYAEAVPRFQSLVQTYAAATPSGVILTDALIQLGAKKNHFGLFERPTEAFIEFLLEPAHSKMLGVTKNPGCLGIIPRIVTGINRTRNRVDQHPDSNRSLGKRMGMGLLQGAIGSPNALKGERQALRLPEEMRVAWGL